MHSRKKTVAALLADQGFGSRKECGRMVWSGLVEVGNLVGAELQWRKPKEPDEQLITEGLHLRVEGLTVPYLEELHVIVNKPIDTECSHTPSHHQSVFSMLPEPFLRRGLEAVGRLDADTTGMLLFSDTGAFNHYFTSPKRHVPKTYRVGTKHSISPEQINKLESGVALRSEDGPTLPAKISILSEKLCDMTLEEGKYHQVKRMFGAVGNRVETIHRIAIGGLQMDEKLRAGQWRILTEVDLKLLGYKGK